MRAQLRRIRLPSCRTSSVSVTSRTWAISLFLNTFLPSLNPAVTRIWSPTLTCIVEETSTSHLPLADGLNCRTFPLLSSVTVAPAQSDMKTVGQKGDEDVCLDAMGKLMKNGANPYISLQIFEGLLDFRELGVIFPKRSWGLLSKVAPQQVLALAPVGFAKLGPVNSETKVKFSFRFFRVWPFRFRLSL